MHPTRLQKCTFAGSVAGILLLLGACSSGHVDEAAGSDDAPVTSAASASGPTVRILAGSAPLAAPYQDSLGNTWQTDRGYDVGTSLQNKDSIAGTADPTLFHGERWASRTQYPNGFSYTFDSMAAGAYAVTLGFAETSVNPVRAAGQRQFDVYVNAARVLTNLDIFAEVGLDRALEKTFVATPVNGQITVRFAPGAVQNPKVSSIAVVPVPMHPIASRFFGIHLNDYGTSLHYGAHRLWDAGVGWWALETAPNTYDFRKLQTRVAETPPGVELMYTFGHTPAPPVASKSFACTDGKFSCNPPADVDGRDDAVKNFWTAFMRTMCTGTAPNKTCGPIKYFEMWNEPNGDGFWSGTYAQLARMSADAATIIKNNCASCVVLTANVSCGGDGSHANGDSGQCEVWMDNYLAAWQKLGHMPDGGAWHAYPSHTNVHPSPFPETNVSSWDICTGKDDPKCTCKAGFVPNKECRHSIVDQVDVMRSVFARHGLAGKPIYATEGGWNYDTDLTDPDLQAAYVSRWLVTLAGSGVAAAYWYAQDNTTWGTLVDSSGNLNQSGRAYNRVHDWLTGGRIGTCAASGTLWSCPVLRADGTPARMMWDSGLGCSAGACPTRKVTLNDVYTRVESLDGTSAPVTGNVVSIGAKPILVGR